MIGQLLAGRYLILEKLGMGGFSETYLASDKYLPHHPLCVVKCLKLSPDNTLSIETAQQFFEIEARLLEELGRHHAQIPTLLAYCQEQEQSYLVQEYIEGENLAHWLNCGQLLSPRQAIAFLLEVLPILSYLYEHRVIHRDVTPGNLIHRRDGKIALIDFGAARLLENVSNPSANSNTLAVGTPGYMPDEQQLGMSQANTDLYALGITTIQFLTGIHPQKLRRNLISGELDWHHHLPKSANHPELIAILDRMVQNSFRDRYQSPAEVLEELQSLPVAKEPVRWKKGIDWQKMTRRLLIPVAVILGIGGFGGWYLQTHGNQAKSFLNQATRLFSKSQVNLTMLHEMPTTGDVTQMAIAPNNQILVTLGSDRHVQLWSLPQGVLMRTLNADTSPLTSLAISRDSGFLVGGGENGMVFLWEISSGKLLRVFAAYPSAVTAVAISPDNQNCVSGHSNGTLRQWNMQTGAVLPPLQILGGEVRTVTYSVASNSLVTASGDRQVQVWNLPDGQLQRTFAGHTDTILGLQVVDDHTLLSFGRDRVMVWDVAQGRLLLVLPGETATPIATSIGPEHIVTVYNNGNVRVWNYRAGELQAAGQGALEKDSKVVISLDQQYLVSWSSNQRLRIWQLHANSAS
jgi:serine/threonine protein kinase